MPFQAVENKRLADSAAIKETFHTRCVWDDMLCYFLVVGSLLTFWRLISPFWRWGRNIHCQKGRDLSKKPFWRWMTLVAVHVTLLAVDVMTFWRWMCFLAVDPDIHCRPETVDELWGLRETRGFAAQRGAQKGMVPPATHRRTARNAWFRSAARRP